MLDNIFIAMATRGRGSVRRARKCGLFLAYLSICINQGKGFGSVYQSADHYWPLNHTLADNTSSDRNGLSHAMITNGGKINSSKLLGKVLVLDGEDDYIDLRLMNEDCTNMPSKCNIGFTIAFWLYYIDGEYLLCTGEYKDDSKGPGIEFTVNRQQKLFVIKISTLKSSWKFVAKLVSRVWAHVAFQWDINEGIQLYLNGSAMTGQRSKKDVRFEPEAFSTGWSMGRPNSILKLAEYGNFGIAHLALWRRELTAMEIKRAFWETILRDQKKMYEKIEKLSGTSIRRSNQTPIKRISDQPTKRPRSGAARKLKNGELCLMATILLVLHLFN